MKRRNLFWIIALLCGLLLAPTIIYGQVTQADYERAAKLRDKLQGQAVNVPERANWIGQTSRFWYRKSIKGGSEFMLVDAETLAKGPAIDHEKLAASLSAAANEKYEALKLPFQSISRNIRRANTPSRATRWTSRSLRSSRSRRRSRSSLTTACSRIPSACSSFPAAGTGQAARIING